MSTSSTIGHAEIAAITQEIWTTMVAMPVTPVPERLVPDKHNGYVVASVQIIGEYEGAVRIDMDYSLAALAAATLLGIDVAELSQEDLRDAAGELANMTGGSVKGRLCPDARISLPSVAIGKDYDFTIPHTAIALQSSFRTDAGILIVTLFRRDARGRDRSAAIFCWWLALFLYDNLRACALPRVQGKPKIARPIARL